MAHTDILALSDSQSLMNNKFILFFRSHVSAFLSCIVGFVSLIFSPFALSEIAGLQFTNVTTRAASVVWVSDTPVNTASVRVYSDVDGTDNITPSLSISLISSSKALFAGIVQVDITGLSKQTTYYVDTITETNSGQEIFPVESAALLDVTTAVETVKADDENKPITNDIFQQVVSLPDGVSVPEAALVVINVPSSQYALSAFVEEVAEGEEPLTKTQAFLDSNNFFDKTTGTSAKLVGGEKMTIQKYRGLACDFENQVLEQNRKVPEHQETPAITELEQPAECFSPEGIPADYNCDGRIGGTDFIKFSGGFGLERPDCKFNSDFDLNSDGRIGGTDFIRFSSVFGSVEE